MADIVPYGNQGFALEQWPQSDLAISQKPGWNGVHFCFDPDDLSFLKGKVDAWFAGCGEIIYVADGDCEKQDLSFMILEWEDCEINPLFLAILRDEEKIDSFSVYFRAAEDYQ